MLATGNPGKAAEWSALLRPAGVDVVSRPEMGDPEESGSSAEDNAWIKALAVALHTGVPALGDDVAVEIDALGGGPGMETRRWADALGGWSAALEALGTTCLGSPGRYMCGLALAWPDGSGVRVTGEVSGVIVAAAGPGIGLEPCFQPIGFACTLSQFTDPQRRSAHPRGLALSALLTSRAR